jgi:starch-binding outer membrane protein, SusD/RagB family
MFDPQVVALTGGGFAVTWTEGTSIFMRAFNSAGVAAQGTGEDEDNIAVPIDDPSITWANYSVGLYASFPNQDFARDAVRHERRLELALEGHRLFDLRRWGIAPQVLNAYLDAEGSR